MHTPAGIFQAASEAARFLRENLDEIPPVAVVLGSGWDALVHEGTRDRAVSFEDVPGFSMPGARGHQGRLFLDITSGGPILIQSGRLHPYEGLEPLDATFPVFALAEAGVRLMVLLSAAGGLNPSYIPGDLMIVTDHIALWGENPLRGLSRAGLTAHVPGAGIYAERWHPVLKECLPPEARCEYGIYAHVPGPSYETPAEARLLRVAGADVVGMSTAPEALAARFLGLEAAAMCCVSNSILPLPDAGLSHDEVLENVRRCAGGLGGFLERLAGRAYMIL